MSDFGNVDFGSPGGDFGPLPKEKDDSGGLSKYFSIGGQVIGSIIGAYFGGPMGAQIGGYAGKTEGGKLGGIFDKDAGSNWTDMLSPGPKQEAAQAEPTLGPLAAAALSTAETDPGIQPHSMLGQSSFGDFKMPNASDGYDPNLIDVPPGTPAPTPAASPNGTATPTPAAPSFGQNFGSALSGIGRVVSGTAAGLQGDNDYFMRLQRTMDAAANEKKRNELMDRQQTLDTFKVMPHVMSYIETLNNTMDPAKKTPEYAAKIANDVNKAMGRDFFDSDTMLGLIGGNGAGSDALESFKAKFEIADMLDEKDKINLSKEYAKNPTSAGKKISDFAINTGVRFVKGDQEVPPKITSAMNADDRKNFKEVAADIVNQKVQEDINSNKLNKEISRADFLKKYKNSNLLTDANWGSIYAQGFKNLQGPEMIKEERKATIARTSQELKDAEIEHRQDKTIAAADARTDKSIAAANERQDKAIANQGVALIAARREAEQNSPLDTKATRWVKPDTLEYASPDMTPKEAKEAGYAVTGTNLSQAVPSARAALKTLDRYEELSKKLLVKKSDSTAGDISRIQGNRLKNKALEAAGNEDVKEFNALGSTVVQHVKAFGDSGNVAVKEAEFQLGAMPNFGDTQESAARKIESRRVLLKTVVKNAISASSRNAETSATQDPLGLR